MTSLLKCLFAFTPEHGHTLGVKKRSKARKTFISLFSAFGCIKLKPIDGYITKNDKIVILEIIYLTPQVIPYFYTFMHKNSNVAP